mgnify:CR=1 FL=1
MKNNHLKALLITILGVLLISLEALFVKLTSIEALSFAFYSGIFMFISTACILLYKNKYTSKSQKITSHLKIVLLCGFLLGLSNIAFISAIKNTSVSNTVLIFSSAPIFSAFYMYVFFREKTTKNIFVASFFILIGLFIIFSSQLGHGQSTGNIYAILAIGIFSLVFVILSRYKNINMLAIISFSSIVTMIISLIFLKNISIDMSNLYILLLAGLLTSPLARVLMGMGTKTLPASEVSLLMIIETIMAPVWVWLFLNEIPTSNTLVGGTVILVTLVLNSLYVLQINKNAHTI